MAAKQKPTQDQRHHLDEITTIHIITQTHSVWHYKWATVYSKHCGGNGTNFSFPPKNMNHTVHLLPLHYVPTKHTHK